jgi:uncharacterized protein (TIGR02265 family)
MAKREDVDNALFEALFSPPKELPASLEAEFLRLGYDRHHAVGRYSGEVFARCLHAAAGALHPTLTVELGLRELGHEFVAGFRETILGRVATFALPMLGPARFLPRLPTRFASIRTDASAKVMVAGPNSATLDFTDPQPVGPFFAGVVERALHLAGASAPHVAVTTRVGGYVLEASW